MTGIYTAATIGILWVTNRLGKSQLATQQELAQLQRNTMIITELGKVDELLNNPTSLGERKIVFDHVSGVEPNGNFRNVAERVSGLFDRVGSLVSLSADLENRFLGLHAQKTGKAWLALKQYVEEERSNDVRDDPEFCRFFEAIGTKSVEFYNAQHPDASLSIKKMKVLK